MPDTAITAGQTGVVTLSPTSYIGSGNFNGVYGLFIHNDAGWTLSYPNNDQRYVTAAKRPGDVFSMWQNQTLIDAVNSPGTVALDMSIYVPTWVSPGTYTVEIRNFHGSIWSGVYFTATFVVEGIAPDPQKPLPPTLSALPGWLEEQPAIFLSGN